MYVSDLASTDLATAFVPFSRLFAPALRRASRSPLKRARHRTDSCAGPTPGSWCADCESVVNDLLLASFNRLRRSLAGSIPQTAAGTSVRELEAVVAHVRSNSARYETVAPLIPVLLMDSTTDEPRWLRAARAQLVHYPALRLEERVRREDAVARGGSARPDRDLRQAVWAAPLRSEPLALELLLTYIGRLRHNAPAPFSTPPDVLSRLGIDPRTARQKLESALSTLRDIRPQYYAANVTAQLASSPIPLHADSVASTDWPSHWS